MKHHKRKAKIIPTHHEQILFWKAGNGEKSVLVLVGKYLQIANKLRIEAKRNLLISAQTKYVGRKRSNVQISGHPTDSPKHKDRNRNELYGCTEKQSNNRYNFLLPSREG